MLKKFIKNIVCIVSISCMFTTLLKNPVYASNEYNLPLTNETIIEINEFLKQYPQYKDYLNDVLKDAETSTIATDIEKLNEHVVNAIEQISQLKQRADKEYMVALEENDKLVKEYKRRTKSARTDSYDILLSNYLVGIAIVNECGCPNTARYMTHAIVPEYSTVNPTTIYDTNTSWSEHLVYDCYDLYDQIFLQFEQEILADGKENGTVSGSFTFVKENSSLDAHVALHSVDYVTTFTKSANGNGYDVTYLLHDTFDFEWNNYDNFVINFGNNYCYAMQVCGSIRPYEIYITQTE